MCERHEMPESKYINFLCYEDLIEMGSDDFIWPIFPEDTASGLCYTSGTTGKPKGVLYSNRSTVLHALLASVTLPDSFAVGRKILPIVPLFHANAWGIPYSAPLTGSSLVFPGQNLDGKSVYDLLDTLQVFSAWGVPTVWFSLLDEIKQSSGFVFDQYQNLFPKPKDATVPDITATLGAEAPMFTVGGRTEKQRLELEKQKKNMSPMDIAKVYRDMIYNVFDRD